MTVTWRWPWEMTAAVRARGGRVVLDEGRATFAIRAGQLTSDEQQWIVANRDRCLFHVQHLFPHPHFAEQARRGFPGF